jgi:hypothetical protein
MFKSCTLREFIIFSGFAMVLLSFWNGLAMKYQGSKLC